MSHQIRTMNNNKKEINMNKNMFHKQDFEGKKVIFIMAKTWGAARVFYFKTALCKFKNIKIEYLNDAKQICGLNNKEVIIIKLDRALENKRNVKIEMTAEERNIKIINYEMPIGV